MKEKKIGVIVILGGLAVIGAVWFKKHKPNNANLQSKELTNQLNSIVGGGAADIDKPFNFQNATPISPIASNGVVDPILASYSTLTPEETQKLKDSIANALSGINFSSLDFSHINIK